MFRCKGAINDFLHAYNYNFLCHGKITIMIIFGILFLIG